MDESGNTGTNLNDIQQPVFVLAALIVPESCWQDLENDLEAVLATYFSAVALDEVEVHAGDLRGGRSTFKGKEMGLRIGLRDEWLKIAHKHPLKLVNRA